MWDSKAYSSSPCTVVWKRGKGIQDGWSASNSGLLILIYIWKPQRKESDAKKVLSRVWHREAYSSSPCMSTYDLNFRVIHFFSLFLSQKGCFIPKKSRDGWLGLSDEKLVSWRRKYDLPCGMQLFDENFLFQFFPNIGCDCTTDNFASFDNFEASNQLNPIRIGCFPAFAFHARFLSSSCIHLEIILAKDESPKNFRDKSIEVSRHSVGLTGKIYVHSGTSTWIFYLMV